MNDVHYETRYVAFLDLLGFKNMVEQSTRNQDILDKINKALNYTCEVRDDNYHGFLPQVELGKQVTTFSDSIIISYNTSTPGGGFLVLIDLVHICIDLLGIGILVRGGVTVGQLIHDEQKCFGPAMNEAYNMELKEAIFPRIIINEDVLKFDLENPGPANNTEWENKYLIKLVKKDPVDDALFLNYLKQYDELDDTDAYLYFISNVKDFIIENLSKFKENERVYKKYEWLKQYYNETLQSFYIDLGEFLI